MEDHGFEAQHREIKISEHVLSVIDSILFFFFSKCY
jgi:hypothetical protein